MADVRRSLGVVVDILDDKIFVEGTDSDFCGGCDKRSYCGIRSGNGRMQRICLKVACDVSGQKDLVLDKRDLPELRIGDELEVVISLKHRLMAYFVLSLLPCLLLVLSYIVLAKYALWGYFAWIPIWLLVLYFSNKKYKGKIEIVNKIREEYENTP